MSIYRTLFSAIAIVSLSIFIIPACTSSVSAIESDVESNTESEANPNIADDLLISPGITNENEITTASQDELPLPAKPQYYLIKSLLDEYRPAWTKFAPLLTEYRLYFRVLGRTETPSDEDLEALKQRANENLARIHWTFLAGCEEIIDYLTDQSLHVLESDRETNFIARMKTLRFIAEELKNLTNKTLYTSNLQELYISLNKRHFQRELQPLKK